MTREIIENIEKKPFFTSKWRNADGVTARNKDIAPKLDQALLLQTLLQKPINNMQRTKILQPYFFLSTNTTL